jgi:internalin A
VSDVSPLAGLTRLVKLRLGSTQVKDFSPVAHILPTLTDQDQINIVGEGMVQFTDANLEQRILEEMGKTEGGVTLLEAAAVTRLDLSRDPFSPDDKGTIRSLSGLERFTGLQFLDLGGNRNLRRLGPISALTGLTALHFCWCDVTDITPLKELTELKELVFGWGNRVHTLDALRGLIKLEAIDAKTAGIRDASGLADLPKLFEVQLCDNQITDVTPFTRLPSLSVLLLANNPITDYSPLGAILPTIETDLE